MTDSIGALTPRQREVLQHLAEGLSTREIAAALKVSAKTVETHRVGIMRRTGRKSLARLVLLAVRDGLVQVA